MLELQVYYGKTQASVRFVFSSDGGSSFEDPIQIDEGEPTGRGMHYR